MIAALLSFAQRIVVSTGYPGIIFVAVLENLFPPLPSEVIFPFAGFVASGEELNLFLVVAAGVTGTFIGALFWYGAGYVLGATGLKALIARYGKPLQLKLADIERAERWFERYETPVIFFGRLIPLIRTFISIPAGFVKMSLPLFSLLTVIGSTIWIGVLSYAGFALGERWESVVPYLQSYQLIFELLILGAVILFILKRLKITRPELPE